MTPLAPAVATDAGAAPAPIPSLTFADSEASLDRGVLSTSFHFLRLRKLWIRTTVSTLPRIAMLHLKLVDPQGQLFREYDALYSADPTIKTYDSNAYPNHPLTVLPAKKVPGGYALDFAIPIAGPFLRVPLPDGTWGVTATVDGLPGSLIAGIAVSMKP